MDSNKRNFSLSIWDHKDNFLCLLKSSNSNFDGQSQDENLTKNIYGEKSLSFNIPMYIFNKDSQSFEKNERWTYIFNEQKIRYVEYDPIDNKQIEIEEFVLKHFSEDREGYEKTISCECESLAAYELGKVGWNIKFDEEYITNYELEQNPDDLLTLDYWLKKIFYYETNLGRVSTTTEATYLLQGLQLRNENGEPINNTYNIENGEYYYNVIDEPVCIDLLDLPPDYLNLDGWCWEKEILYKNDPSIISYTTNIYEEPVVNNYLEGPKGVYQPYSYQKEKDSDAAKELKLHPIEKENYGILEYVTDIKRRLITVERSNVFNIIQDLCEIFNVWAYFNYKYNNQGKIIERKILFKSEAINKHITFDFSYGKNLQSCSRIIDSNELVTKLMIPDVDSQLIDNNILSIKQASANPTGEGYLYNFDYFYEINSLSRLFSEEKNNQSVEKHSDEYYINSYYNKLKNLNNKIINIQKYLTPLYDKQNLVSSELSIAEGSLIGYKENIESIQNKIDAIPQDEQILKSWSEDNSQYNHVGELKTFSTTTYEGQAGWHYLNFGREDVLYDKDFIGYEYHIENDELVQSTTEIVSVSSFIPRAFKYQEWHSGDEALPEDNEEAFILFDEDSFGSNNIKVVKSELGNDSFIQGIYFNQILNDSTYSRIRFKYAPLAYYYLLIKDYWEKIKEAEQKVDSLKEELIEINNKIFVNELEIKNILSNKNELILQFEKKYKPFIREGYWEPSNYQSQFINKTLIADEFRDYQGLLPIEEKLGDLNLNNSLHNYTYYIDLNILASEIDIDSITMETPTKQNTWIPRYKGVGFDIYIKSNNKILLAISPTVIDNYIVSNYEENLYKSKVHYYTSGENSESVENTYNWIQITESNNPIVIEKNIYLIDNNLSTDTMIVKGHNINGNEELILLEPYVDYNLNFEPIAYDSEGNRVDIREYNFDENIKYDYVVKINIKNTNTANICDYFIVYYNIENTLGFLYNDAETTSKKYAVPQISYEISVVDLSNLNGYENYKPILGQKVPIYDIEMGINGHEGFITSISRVLEQPENTEITIATYSSKFEDVFSKITATVTDINYNENNILKAANSFSSDGTIKSDVFQKSLDDNNLKISLGTDNQVTIDNTNGVMLIDNDSKRAVKMIGNGIFLSDDIEQEGNWRTGITGEGINASNITVGNIDTKNINIWNSSEGQIRFIWNEEGLFAYGDKFGGDQIESVQDLINYNKFVKYSYDGLQFQDEEDGVIRSALSLGWNGLNINAQNNSLNLNAEKGLTIEEWQNNQSTTRLELGKINNGAIYGLRLYDKFGDPTFQNDSDGNLWLSKFINVGGKLIFDSSNNLYSYSENPNAGIVGLGSVTTSTKEYQMGIIHDPNTGEIRWDDTAIRFWAGPLTKEEYLASVGVLQSDLTEEDYQKYINTDNYNPTFSKFKVDAYGKIIASGFDIGGWSAAGKTLHSNNYEAILRSSDYYNINDNELPVIAIGKQGTDRTGLDYNLKLYKDGRIYIGGNSDEYALIIGSDEQNAKFKVKRDGTVEAIGLEIGGSETNINGGNLGGWHISNLGLYKDIIYPYEENGQYRVGMYPSDEPGKVAFFAGHRHRYVEENNELIDLGPEFKVDMNGKVTASSIVITGGNGNWIIDSPYFKVDNYGQIGAGLNNASSDNYFNGKDYSFSVDSTGTIRFKGNISAWYKGIDDPIGSWYKGIDSDIVTITIGNIEYSYRVIKGLIVGKETRINA